MPLSIAFFDADGAVPRRLRHGAVHRRSVPVVSHAGRLRDAIEVPAGQARRAGDRSPGSTLRVSDLPCRRRLNRSSDHAVVRSCSWPRARRRRAASRCRRRRPARRGGRPRPAGRRRARAPGRRGRRSTGGGRWRSWCDPSASLREGVRDAHLGERVDRRGRLVEHQHVGVGDTGPQQRDQLTLAGRQRVAAFADPRVESVGQRRPPSRRRRADRRVARSRSRVASGRANRMLLAIVSSNRNGSWATTTIRRRSSALSISASGTPPSRTCPAIGSAKRATMRPSVVLPEPVAPTTATCWPAGMNADTCSSTMSSRRSARSPRLRYENVTSSMSIEKRPGGQRLGMRRRRRADRDVEHAEHAPQAGDRGLGLVEHLGELGDRLEEAVREEDEADQRAGGHAARRARRRRRRRRSWRS